MNFEDYFPYKTIREQQKIAAEFAIDQIENHSKRFIVIEAGTGVGKSAIGLTVARYLYNNAKTDDAIYENGSYFLTTQKILQQQYISDFGGIQGIMKSVYSSTNYRCSREKSKSCKEVQQLLRVDNPEVKNCRKCLSDCNYKKSKKDFLDSYESVTNFPYFITESAYSGKIVPRKVLVIDEAHNIEKELSKFVEVLFSERFSKSVLKIKWPNQHTPGAIYRWIRDVYHPKAQSRLTFFEQEIEKKGLKSKLADFEKLSKNYDMLSGHVEKVVLFLKTYSSDNWVLESIPAVGRSGRKFKFRPIDISNYAQSYLFRLGYYVICMSATILDINTFCQTLGLNSNDVGFISLASPFKPENRPVVFLDTGYMTRNSIDKSLKNVASAVRELLKQHKHEKGVIHCHTYKIANYIKNNVRDKRLLVHDPTNRDKILEKHKKSKQPTVLISPSMSEGVDLKGDLSRFQLICKVPYPYLGDPIVKKRMNKYSDWYPLQTAMTVVQSAGRSVRSSEDQAVTYILDSDWYRFYSKNKKLFPQDFKDALV